MAKKGYKITPAVIERLKKARSNIKNRKCSEETKKKLSIANTNNPKLKIKRSKEFKEKLSKIAKERGLGTINKGKKLSLETRKKMSESRRMEKHPNWKGGRIKDGRGYIRIKKDGVGYKAEHRIIAENTIGRELLPDEDVHHINGIKDDNRPENLQVLSHEDHLKITHQGNRKQEGLL